MLLAAAEQLPTGGRLALAVERLQLEPMDSQGSVRLAHLCHRLIAWAQAQAMIPIAGAIGGDDLAPYVATHSPAQIIAQDLATEIHLTYATARHHVDLVGIVSHQLPLTWEALNRGDITIDHVRHLIAATAGAGTVVALEVDRQLIPLAIRYGWTPQKLAKQASNAIKTIDPDGAAERAKTAKRTADVRLYPATDDTALIEATGDAMTMRQMMDAIDARADTLAGEFGELPIGMRRLKALASFVLGDNHINRNHIDGVLAIDLTTWLGLTNTPGEISGYGPITADYARELSKDAAFRIMITDPETGQTVFLGRTRYRPTAALQRLIERRDQVCQFPGCEHPAIRCDIDHKTTWTRDGLTNPANLHALCRMHHNLKTHRLWTITPDPDGGPDIWTSPLGFTRRKHRDRYPLEPLQPPDHDDPPDDILDRIPNVIPPPEPGPLPEPPTITLEEFFEHSDDLDRRAIAAANRYFFTHPTNDDLDIAS